MKKEISFELLKARAVDINTSEGFLYTSGRKGPVYCDNRILLSYPKTRKKIIEGFLHLIKEKELDCDFVAGVATGAIAWGAIVADRLGKPFVYVRALAKDHGKTNQIEGELEEGKKVPISDFHVVIGVIYKNQIFLTGVGNLTALFMHRTAKQRFVIYELDRQFHTGDAPTWQKPFLTVLDGELHPGDSFYVATRISPHEISLGELQDVLVMLPPSGALVRIQQYLNIGSPYGAICLRVQEQELTGPPKKINPLHSIEQLGKTKEATASILGEQSPDFRALVGKTIAPIINKLSAPGTRGTKSTIRSILKAVVRLLATAAVFVYATIRNIAQAVAAVVQRLFSKYKKAKGEKKTKEVVKDSVASAKKRFQKLPKTSKYIALGVLVVLVLLIGSISIIGSSKDKQEAEMAFQTIVSRIEEKKNAAEASLIYQDDEQARTILTEAVALLETLSADSKSREADIQRLKDELNTVFATLRGMTEVSPSLLADLGLQDEGAVLTSAVEVGAVIYAVTDGLALYRFNDLEQILTLEDSTLGSIGKVVISTEAGNDFLFVDENKRLGRANLTNNTLNPIVSGTESLQSVEDIKVYNDNVYALTAQGQQIVKMRPQGDGYDAGTPWTTSRDSDISSARSLAIDGDIYVLTANSIVKFATGSERPFILDTVDPGLTNPTSIWTDIASNYLYVLDPPERRVIVFEKDGNFVTQFVSEEFHNAIAMIVREDKKTIIVVTTTKLFSFPAEHLLK
ncbi:hypothetical protein IH979_01150 [Patescibacteria group bacterium]|nr:hypothetical protein [Patescibacteria group bacterium]